MKTNETPEKKPLTPLEIEFCELYVNGGIEFAGQPIKCYRAIFGEGTGDLRQCRVLITRVDVVTHIKEIMSTDRFELETQAVKLQVAETLKAVMEEAATSNYIDRFGAPISPAPLRAVSVNAAKALMEIYPIRHVQENKLRIEGGDGNVVFNVIMPQVKNEAKEDN